MVVEFLDVVHGNATNELLFTVQKVLWSAQTKGNIFSLWICLQCCKSMAECKFIIYIFYSIKMMMSNNKSILAWRLFSTYQIRSISRQFKVGCWVYLYREGREESRKKRWEKGSREERIWSRWCRTWYQKEKWCRSN